MTVEAYLKKKNILVEAELRRLCLALGTAPPILRRAIEYTLFSPGKRIRPILALAAAEASGGRAEDVLPFAAAIEMIHTYSLIHDDLPSLDNDDFRRGRPTCHKKFGEAYALLAGDALLTEAFRVMSDPASAARIGPERAGRIAHEVAAAAGAEGMVGGQVMDIRFESLKGTRAVLRYIHSHKTTALIRVSLRAGAIAAGAGDPVLGNLTRYGECVGLAFQIVDDLLDATGDESKVGKRLRKDINKQTYIKHYGIEASRRKVERLVSQAEAAVAPLGDRGAILIDLARFVGSRAF